VKTTSLRTPSYILILSLAISDFGVGVLLQPAYFSLLFAQSTINVPLLIISASIISKVFLPLVAASLLTVTAVTIDRFLAIHMHLRYQELVTTKRSCVVVITILIISLSCGLFYSMVKHTAVEMVNVILIFFVVLLNIFLMLKIYRFLRRQSAQIQAQQQSAQPTINMQRYKRSVNTMYYITGVFVLCYCPTLFTYITFLVTRKTGIELFILYILTYTLLVLNSLLNPVIYFWRIQEMRNAVVQLMRSVRCQCQ